MKKKLLKEFTWYCAMCGEEIQASRLPNGWKRISVYDGINEENAYACGGCV